MALASEKTLLIVDDEPDVRSFLSACAEDAGFKVVTAVDGEDAIAKVQTVNPDLMTLDMVMPKKSGYKVLKELRAMERYAELPVIVITAHANDEMGSEDIKKMYTTFSGPGAPKFTLEKPITPQKLVKAIAEILDVDLEASTPKSSQPADLAGLLRGASPDTLEKVRQLLSKQ
ncbi:MAG: response regulator [Desulfovibrio sp.]|jgi:CheY-like chemotaxis protein|nr:response regulator [Desulfovibrio sp.]